MRVKAIVANEILSYKGNYYNFIEQYRVNNCTIMFLNSKDRIAKWIFRYAVRKATQQIGKWTSNQRIKLKRAYGECLGNRSRRRTW